VCPLISLLPWVSDELRSTPILRLARLLSAAAFGARAGGALVRPPEATRSAPEEEPLRISLRSDEHAPSKPLEWEDLLHALPHARGVWFQVSGAAAAHIRELGAATRVPGTVVEAMLGSASFPRAHGSAPFSTLFVWLPTIRQTHPTTIDRLGVLFLTNGELAITLSPTRAPIQEAMPVLLAGETSSESFGARALLSFLRGLLDRHEHVTGEIEQELRLLETLGGPGHPPRVLRASLPPQARAVVDEG
jgi:hypothetical protein